MVTKSEAASISMEAGTCMVISNGTGEKPISYIQNGGRCTWFMSNATPKSARKNWISGSLKATGTLFVDDGATFALRGGKSLLPAGVTKVDGDFERGDAVIVIGTKNIEIARGLVAYSANDAKKILGHKTDEIEKILGYRRRDEMIHRDDLVLS